MPMPDAWGMAPTGPHAAVCNPVTMDPARLAPLIADQEQALGWGETRWFTTSAEDAGRDGTTRAVAQKATGASVPMAIVPVGSANVLARKLGLRISALQDVVRVAFTDRDRAVDGEDGAGRPDR